MEKPDVDRIDGIAPAIAIRQKNSVRNPRSTVGTTTEIHDYMRLLFARVGRTLCRGCGREVVRETAEVVARQLGELPSGTRLLLGFDLPVVETSVTSDAPEVDELIERPDAIEPDSGTASEQPPARNGHSAAAPALTTAVASLRRKGFARLLVDGRAVTIDDVDLSSIAGRSVLQVVVDRVQLTEDMRQRLTDSIETAYTEGGGAAWALESPAAIGDGGPASAVMHLFSEG